MDVAYVPSPRGDFIDFSRSPKGRLFRKRILSYGDFTHPNDPKAKLHIDLSVGERLVQNFQSGVCDIVQIPIVDGDNKHVEDPLRNAGEVVDLTAEPDGVWAILDVRKPEYADEIGNTLLGASAMMHMDYEDTRTGTKVGPTLLHVAITNRPYITNLGDFESAEGLIAASAKTYGESPVVLVSDDEEVERMGFTKEELLTALREEHGIDVAALEAQAQQSTDELVQAFAAVLRESGTVALSATTDDGITIQDVAEAVIEVSTERAALSRRVEELETEAEVRKQQAAEAEVDGLIRMGKVLPFQKDAMVFLAVNDRERFQGLVPSEAVVSLSEDGVTTHADPDGPDRLDAEVERLSQMAEALTPTPRRRSE